MTEQFQPPPMTITPGLVAMFRNCNTKKLLELPVIGLRLDYFVIEYNGSVHIIPNLRSWMPKLTYKKLEWRV